MVKSLFGFPPDIQRGWDKEKTVLKLTLTTDRHYKPQIRISKMIPRVIIETTRLDVEELEIKNMDAELHRVWVGHGSLLA